MADDRPDPHSCDDADREGITTDLQNALAVQTAMREIDAAIADLAASPLDEPAAERMHAVLQGPQLARARKVLRELAPRGAARSRRHLSLVRDVTAATTAAVTAPPAPPAPPAPAVPGTPGTPATGGFA